MAVGVRALCPVLIGREAELSALEDALLSARRGQGGVVILGGEAGMGKTRLASELVRRAERLGCVVMSGGCTEAEVALPYLPFLEAIGNHLALVDVARLVSQLGPAANELGQLFPQLGISPGAGGDPVTSKLRLFEAMLMLLTGAAGSEGLLLVLEDLHWADPATRELLDYLTRRLRSTNVLTLATYRTEELHRKHALLPTIQGWKRSGTVELVEVEPLATESVGRMLCAIFDQERVSDAFTHFIRERSEGNPFVIEEMLKEAIDRGDIFRTEEGWDRKDLRELRVPPTVRDGILLRLERLAPEDAQVLSAASVVGRSFDVEVIASTAQISAEQAVDSLQRCVLNQLVEEDEASPGTYRFRHALTREAIYEDMITPRRQLLHARVAGVLQERGAPAAELAHHMLLARRDEAAVELCKAASEEAFRGLAYSDAASLLERAVPLVKDDVERGRLLCRAGSIRWENQETAPARRLLEEGVETLEAAGEREEAAASRILIGRCYWELQRSDDAERQFEMARASLEPLGPSEALAMAYVRLAGIRMFNNRYEEALRFAERAEEIATAANAERALSTAWIFMAGSLQYLGELDRGDELVERAYLFAVARRFWLQAGNATFNQIWMSIHLGRGRTARRWLERTIAEVPTHMTDTWIGYAAALCRIHEGRLVEALEGANWSAERAAEAGNQKQNWRSTVLRAHVLAELGRGEEAAAVLPPVSSRTDRQDAVYDGAARIRTAIALADLAAARHAALGIDTPDSVLASPLDAAASVLLDEPEQVARIAASVGDFELPRHLVVRGAAALAGGEFDIARDLLTRAMKAFSEEGLHLDVWYAALLLARAEAAAGAAQVATELLDGIVSDAEPAQARLVQRLAAETAETLGLTLALPPSQSPAPEPALTGERLVTVLFADVRGYTQTVAASSPADLGDRMAAFQRWAASAVAEHHGVVDKFAGDAVMATFNVSGTSVDHAEHAVLCGREIADKGAAGGLPVGVGIATGAAVVGRLSTGANLSVLGLATNLAARLQAASGAGEVTVSEETYRRLGGPIKEGAERIELELKGFPEPVTAYRLSGGPPRRRGAGGRASGEA